MYRYLFGTSLGKRSIKFDMSLRWAPAPRPAKNAGLPPREAPAAVGASSKRGLVGAVSDEPAHAMAEEWVAPPGGVRPGMGIPPPQVCSIRMDRVSVPAFLLSASARMHATLYNLAQ
jgi:hypothetical protein